MGKGSVLVGPRRLVLLVDDLPEREPDEWVKGPPENLREKAAEGFAKKQGVGVAISRSATASLACSSLAGRSSRRCPSG